LYHIHFNWLIPEVSGTAIEIWLIVANSPTREFNDQE
jgi:hypothetical protein